MLFLCQKVEMIRVVNERVPHFELILFMLIIGSIFICITVLGTSARPVYVRSHWRVQNGKRVHVKAYWRKH